MVLRSINKKLVLLVPVAILIAVVFSACSSGNIETPSNVQPKLDAVHARTENAITTSKNVEKGNDYFYDPLGKRDPFAYFEKFLNSPPTKVDEQYEITDYKLKAIIWGLASPLALVVDPKGKSHIIKQGTLIGKNWGKVVKIKSDLVLVQAGQQIAELKLPADIIEAYEEP